jgi:hypothetical protein
MDADNIICPDLEKGLSDKRILAGNHLHIFKLLHQIELSIAITIFSQDFILLIHNREKAI